MSLGSVQLAAAGLEKSVALEPGNWNAHLLLGQAYLRLGRSSQGEREMRLGQDGQERSDHQQFASEQHWTSSVVLAFDLGQARQ